MSRQGKADFLSLRGKDFVKSNLCLAVNVLNNNKLHAIWSGRSVFPNRPTICACSPPLHAFLFICLTGKSICKKCGKTFISCIKRQDENVSALLCVSGASSSTGYVWLELSELITECTSTPYSFFMSVQFKTVATKKDITQTKHMRTKAMEQRNQDEKTQKFSEKEPKNTYCESE